MEGLASVTGNGGIQAVKLQTEYAIRAAKMQQDAMNLQGDLAMKLIQTATADPAVGQNLNLLA